MPRRLKNQRLNVSNKSIVPRYSYRAFTSRRLPAEDLEIIEKLALAASYEVDQKPRRVLVVNNQTLIEEMDAEGTKILSEMPDTSLYKRIKARKGRLFFGARCMIIILVAETLPVGTELFECSVVAENIVLAATSMGVDSLICGLASFPFAGGKGAKFSKRLKFPEGYRIGLGVLLGYAAKPVGKRKPYELDWSVIGFIKEREGWGKAMI